VARILARRADVERRRRVAVEAIVERRDVDVDDVAVLDGLLVGDAVADHVVDRRADALREASVVQRCRPRAAPDRVLVNERVDLVRRHSCPELLADEHQRLGRHPARDAHRLDLPRALDLDRHR
jgi:hypothetical protein